MIFRNACHVTNKLTVTVFCKTTVLVSYSLNTETLNTISYLSKSKEDKLSLNAFGPGDKKCDLPMVDVIQAFAGIHCNDGVGIQAVSSLWWLPAVKETGHC